MSIESVFHLEKKHRGPLWENTMSLGVICALDQLVSGLERSGSCGEARLAGSWVGPRGVDMYIGLNRRDISVGRPRQQ